MKKTLKILKNSLDFLNKINKIYIHFIIKVMTKKEKLLEKFKENPESLKGSELEKLLLDLWFVMREWKWSHRIYKNGDVSFSLPVGHAGEILPIYFKKVHKKLFSENQ